METQPLRNLKENEFELGSCVIYAMHGKCNLSSVETKLLNGESIQFYKLEVKKSPFSKSGKSDSAIWVPVASAKERGLRLPMTLKEAQLALQILSNREYYFQLEDPWTSLQHQFENCIRNEGGIGLSKVSSFLYVLGRKQVVPTPEVNKLQETIHRLLYRELSDVLNEPMKTLEERINKGMKVKLAPDH